MSKAIIDEQYLTDIADSIRAKNGSADTYTPSEMATAIDNLPTPTPVTKGLVFSDYDADGYPHKAEVVGFTNVPDWYGWRIFDTHNVGMRVETLTIADGTEKLGTGCFSNNDALQSVVFPASTTVLGGFASCTNLQTVIVGGTPTSCQNVFPQCTKVSLYDFSHATAVPSLGTANSIGHASGCVIKIPSALYTAWTTHAIWGALTDVVWQAV